MKALFTLKSLLLGSFFIFAVAAPVATVALPQTAAAAGPTCEGRVLGIPPWYRGLTQNNPPKCDLKEPSAVGGIGNYIWKIVLNVIEMAIILTTYLTAFFIIYGGFLYMTGGAIPGQIEKAKKTLINAVVGLVICLSAVALTNLVFSLI